MSSSYINSIDYTVSVHNILNNTNPDWRTLHKFTQEQFYIALTMSRGYWQDEHGYYSIVGKIRVPIIKTKKWIRYRCILNSNKI